MAEGLGRERWSHTSMICSLIANAHRNPKTHRTFKPADFDPYSPSRNQRPWQSKQVASKQDLQFLKEALTSSHQPRKQKGD
ncbi:hypothetical protein [Poriferisphaera corsica]|uniref:hypothetical protein n=1 Tax=Poriferisphaera corsica TaxID=2528020 RepID=UPI00119E2C32|nr:hypothetical protein [Poriferisphaera corsica]